MAAVGSRDNDFDRFIRSIDAAAHHARSLRMQLYPTDSQSSKDSKQVVIVVQAIAGAPLNQSRWRADLQATILLELDLPDAAEVLSPTGFFRAAITSGVLNDTLDGIRSTKGSDADNLGTTTNRGRDPLVVFIGSVGIRTTLPLDFFASLEQHVVHGQQIYCPVGTASQFQASVVTQSSRQDVPLVSGAPVIGASLVDMQTAVTHPGMIFWTANSAWVGSESWALLRTFSHAMGLQIARPREPGLHFAPASVHTGAELATLPSWWSAAARTGLCISDPASKTTRYPHHPGLLSRVSLQGVQYYDSTGLPAPAATQDELSMRLIRRLSREAAANPRASEARCSFQIDSVGRLLGSLSHQPSTDPSLTPNLRCASLPLGHIRPVACRLALLDLMISVSAALSASGVIHWLEFGTLLGALREHDIIAHTNDVDMASLLSKKADILAMRSGLLNCGVEMRNKAHRNDRNGVGVVDYVELIDQRFLSADGTPEIKLDLSLRVFIPISRIAEDGVQTWTSMLVDPTDNFLNTVRSAVTPSEILPLKRCEVGGVGFPCPNDGVALVRRYYGDDCMEVIRGDVHVAANGDGHKRIDRTSRMRSEL